MCVEPGWLKSYLCCFASFFVKDFVVVSIFHRQTMTEQYLLIILKKINSDLLVVAKIFTSVGALGIVEKTPN